MEHISREPKRKYIDAEEFKAYKWKRYKTVEPELTDPFWLYITKQLTENLCRDIDEFPAADVRPVVHGHWEDRGSLSARCSECGCKSLRESDYCPDCGADMREDKQE